ncbi:MAG TPA: helix-turn-helix domain-containing protein, partial [bacterium]
VINKLMEYHWPGNVRELENTIERMVVMAKGNVLSLDEVPLSLGLYSSHSAPAPAGSSVTPSMNLAGNTTLAETEKMKVMEAMERCGGVQAKACKLLGVTPRQLGYKLKKYKIGYKPTFL